MPPCRTDVDRRRLQFAQTPRTVTWSSSRTPPATSCTSPRAAPTSSHSTKTWTPPAATGLDARRHRPSMTDVQHHGRSPTSDGSCSHAPPVGTRRLPRGRLTNGPLGRRPAPRAGDCRELAHVAISPCRAIGVPARDVSGYGADVDLQDFHGFFEAYVGPVSPRPRRA